MSTTLRQAKPLLQRLRSSQQIGVEIGIYIPPLQTLLKLQLTVILCNDIPKFSFERTIPRGTRHHPNINIHILSKIPASDFAHEHPTRPIMVLEHNFSMFDGRGGKTDCKWAGNGVGLYSPITQWVCHDR